jgi:ubiquitin-protein ligase
MLSPRIRRLKLDHDQLMQKFTGWPLIQITGTAGMPPEVYRFAYNIKGLYVSSTGEIQERAQHFLEVNLSLGYPRRAPQCRMLTPVFHPNFDDSTVCIGDFWAASEGLDDLIVRIGRMIAYQEYNTKSPLNGLAAKWAEQHATFFPVDTRDIAPPLEKVTPPSELAVASQTPVDLGNNGADGAQPTATPEVAIHEAAPNLPADSGVTSDPWTGQITIE